MSIARKLFSPAYWRSEGAVASWLRGVGWLFSSAMIERGAALVQTVLIARAIGDMDYGRYGLLFATIAAWSPIVSLQLPYSIVYFVARFQTRDPAQAGAIVLLGQRLTLATTLAALAAAVLLADPLSQGLFDASGYGVAIVLSGVILFATVQAGLSDALLQASERFRTLAVARVSTAIVGLALVGAVYLAAPTLNAVLAAVAAGALIRLIAVAIPARAIGRRLVAHNSFRSALEFLPQILHFALPSGLLSVLTGWSLWAGSYYVTRSAIGFHELAVINTGVQWRTPILVVMASLSSAILPMLGRFIGDDDHGETRRLQRYHIAINLGAALAFSAIAIAASSVILGWYGPGFQGENFLFGLFLIALVPTAYVTARQQELVAGGRMWFQLLLFAPFAAITVGGTLWYSKSLTGPVLGYIQLSAWVITASLYAIAVRPPGARPAAGDK